MTNRVRASSNSFTGASFKASEAVTHSKVTALFPDFGRDPFCHCGVESPRTVLASEAFAGRCRRENILADSPQCDWRRRGFLRDLFPQTGLPRVRDRGAF